MNRKLHLKKRRMARISGALFIMLAAVLAFAASGVGARRAPSPVKRTSAQDDSNVLAVSVNTSRIAFASDRDGNYEVYVMDSNGGNLLRLTQNVADDRDPAWSPDGTRIAFSSTRNGNTDIYIINADGSGNETRLTTAAGADIAPAWAPDNSKIAFVSGRGGNDEIYTMNIDGSAQTNISNNVYDDYAPSYSPDSQFIAFSSTRDFGYAHLFRMDILGGGVVQLTSGDRAEINPTYASGGRIYFETDRSDSATNQDIYIISDSGTGLANVSNNAAFDADPSRSGDGTRVAFSSSRDGNFEIYTMNADGSGQTRLTNTSGAGANNIQPAFSLGGALQTVGGATTIQISATSATIAESSATVTFTVTRSGVLTAASTVEYGTVSGTATDRMDFAPAFGTLTFAANETSKTVTVSIIDDALIEDNETFSVSLGTPTNAALGANSSATVTITDNDSAPMFNPIDDATFFVRQQYLDFLSREPDAPGLAFWVNQINQCGADPSCIAEARVTVSQAFFQSQEFQETGYFVIRLYRATYGTNPTYSQFIRDRARVIGGSNLAAARVALANDFVTRDQFLARYPATLTNEQFVNRLFDTASLTPFTAERQAEINAMNTQGRTRAQVLQNVIEIAMFRTREFNQAFVLMQYFGYLRRDPDPPGFAFWLNVLNTTNDQRFMVRSFITSLEYRQRFGAN